MQKSEEEICAAEENVTKTVSNKLFELRRNMKRLQKLSWQK